MKGLLSNWKRTLGIAFGILVVVAVLIQFIPVDRTNPPVSAEPNWDSPQTRALAKDACFDCHSNETVWPLYAKIAPVSWLIARDVDEGRSELNFSEWGRGETDIDELEEVINEGEMPPWYYTVMHPEAKLSDSEKQQLIDGLYLTVRGAGAQGIETDQDSENDEGAEGDSK